MSYFEQTYGEILDIAKMYSIITKHVPMTEHYDNGYTINCSWGQSELYLYKM
jgi:hypothetical protein